VCSVVSVKFSAAAVLAIAVGVGGCAQSYLAGSNVTPRPATTEHVFDWLDSRSPAGERPPGSGPTARNSAGPTNAEIYYGGDPGLFSAAEGQGRIVTANLSGGAPLADSRGSGQRAQANDPAPGSGLTRTGDDSISLNFENADVKSVARAILGDVLNLNFVIDPSITGTITLSTRRPIRRNQLLLVLENALRARGAVIVQESGFVRIVPDKDATGMGTANVGRDAGGEGYGITALPLENISADALSKILDGFGAQARSIRIDPERNLLIVRGTYAERQQLIETALAFDVDWMRKQTVGIFPVRNTSADVVIAELNKVFDSNLVRYQPIERMNAILAVSKSPQAIRQASSWVSRLDRMNDAGIRVRVYRLKHADARRVAAMVRDVFGVGGTGQSIGDPGQVAPDAEKVGARVAATTTTLPGAGTQSDAGPGASTTVAVETPIDTGDATRKIRVTADVANNAVVVHAGQQEAILIERAIRELDRAPVQVAIEATIAEITLNDSLSNGVQFYLKGKWGSISQSNDNLPLARVVPGLNLVLGNEATPRLVLDALREVTDVKVLSSPSLVVVDNQPAILQVGDQVPITTRSAQGVTDPLAPIVNSIDFRDTGVILRVTPRVHANSMVGIEIEQEISAVKESTTTTATPESTLTPTISQRRVKSTVSVGDGQTLVLGGLISEQRSKGKSGIPGVVDIPVFGNLLAGRHSDTATRTELIIFIKPQVVRNTIDARRVAEDLRRRMTGFERW
jgi:general secretion pathway protein D